MGIDEYKIPKLEGLTLNIVAPGAALFNHWLFDSLSKFGLLKVTRFEILITLFSI